MVHSVLLLRVDQKKLVVKEVKVQKVNNSSEYRKSSLFWTKPDKLSDPTTINEI